MPLTFIVKSLTSLWTSDSDETKETALCVYQVQASEPCTPRDARLAAGVPIRGDNYPGTTGGFPCTGVKAKAVDQTRMLFRVEADYDSTNVIDANPLLAPVVIATVSETFEQNYFLDETTPTPKKVRNTAGTPFVQLPTRERSRDIHTIKKNVASSTTYGSLKAIQDKVNSDSVTLNGYAYAVNKLRVIATALSETKTANGINYKEQTITVKEHPDGWDQKFESLGLESLVDGHYFPIMENGRPINAPWPLTSTGTQAARGDPGAEIVFKPYVSAAMSGSLT